jgi:hypothetical protein
MMAKVILKVNVVIEHNYDQLKVLDTEMINND